MISCARRLWTLARADSGSPRRPRPARRVRGILVAVATGGWLAARPVPGANPRARRPAHDPVAERGSRCGLAPPGARRDPRCGAERRSLRSGQRGAARGPGGDGRGEVRRLDQGRACRAAAQGPRHRAFDHRYRTGSGTVDHPPHRVARGLDRARRGARCHGGVPMPAASSRSAPAHGAARRLDRRRSGGDRRRPAD